MRRQWRIFTATALIASGSGLAAQTLFEARRMPLSGSFTGRIEGPATDAAGNLYVCNFGRDGVIGVIAPGSRNPRRLFALPTGSIPNGIRLAADGRMFIADWKGHTIFVRRPGASSADTYFRSAQFHQPNDLAIMRDGTLFASDPDFHGHTGGRIWRIAAAADGTVSGSIMPTERQMHLTNGLDLSPDEKTLYVSESDTREVWAYTLEGGRLSSPRLLRRFETGELDGLRTDVRGRIFLARPGAGVVSVLEPDGALSREVHVQGTNPSNVTFGGPNGRTVYITNATTKGIERFLADAPGREICWRDSLSCE